MSDATDDLEYEESGLRDRWIQIEKDSWDKELAEHTHKFIDTHSSSNSSRYTVWVCNCGQRKRVEL